LPVRSLGSSLPRLSRHAKEPNARCVPRFFFSKQVRQNKMEYVIAFGVVAVMALYVLIIARCLREPEWQ